MPILGLRNPLFLIRYWQTRNFELIFCEKIADSLGFLFILFLSCILVDQVHFFATIIKRKMF
jgi:hypothetical protein